MTERLWTKAPGWSRAQKVALTDLVDPVAIALDDEGIIYLVTVDANEEMPGPSVVALDREANTLWEQAIETEVNRLDNPNIVWDGELLHVFWIGDNRLYGATVDKSGEVVDGPQLLSGQTRVGGHAVDRGPDDALSVWFAGPRRDPGLYALPVGDLQGRPMLVDPEGTRPAIKYDQDGMPHVTWVQHLPGSSSARLFYGAYPFGEYDAELASEIHTERLALTSVFSGPFIELDGESAYVVWSEETRTGSRAGQAMTHYLAFPMGQPGQQSRPVQVIVPSDHDLEYEYTPEEGLDAGPRVLLEPGAFGGASGLNRIGTNNNLANEGVIVSESRINYLFSKTAPQIGLSYFQDGSPNGYQLISFTSSASTSPATISDAEGRLYLTWLERVANEFHVYFASTAPDIVDNLNSLTLTDTRQLAGDTVFGLLIGALLTPIALVIWLIIPLAVLLVTSPMRKEDQTLRSPGTIISLGLAVLAYLVVKTFTLPGIREYVPFSAWLPLPPWMELPLQIIVPLGITLVALLAAWTFTYRRNNNAPVYFIIIFGAADSLMTMAVYGVIIYNAL
ncbi:MAG: hypothetical protein JSW55_18390 [Chloroflexota bacterium]|nr:MAG: hypothetical protein JSW55_18390 [Chloroflexota bacterium]